MTATRTLIDAAPVRAHLEKLTALGWTVHGIVRANDTGAVSEGTIRKVLNGEYKRCSPKAHEAVMWMDPTMPPEPTYGFPCTWLEYQWIGVPDHEAAKRMGITYDSMETMLTRHGFDRSRLLVELAREERDRRRQG